MIPTATIPTVPVVAVHRGDGTDGGQSFRCGLGVDKPGQRLRCAPEVPVCRGWWWVNRVPSGPMIVMNATRSYGGCVR